MFSFLSHFAWEMIQAPLYARLPSMSHWEGIRVCLAATLGDAGIALGAYWGVAILVGRQWPLQPGRGAVIGFVALGLAATVLLEWFATGPADRWQYADTMPRLPVLGTGLAPLAQWVVIPPAVLWLARRHLWGAASLAGRLRAEPDPRSRPGG